MKEDWHFDLVMRREGEYVVEASASPAPTIVIPFMTRAQVLRLRQSINKALREYPQPDDDLAEARGDYEADVLADTFATIREASV
jgi:hypothetical protein